MAEPNSDPIYLDHNATTPTAPEVADAMLPWLRDHFGNPSSRHVYGRRTRGAIEQAREQVASLIGCEPDEIIFTSGGTESNNLAIFGTVSFERPTSEARVVTSGIEHPATKGPCAALRARGATVVEVGVDGTGRVHADAIEAALPPKEQHGPEATTLVTVMHANNETGTLQPIEDIAHRAVARGAIVHTDAAQSVGKVAIDVRALGVDLLSVAGHKLYAPPGVGALFVRRGVTLCPYVLGANHERGLRPGTENVPGLVALGAACRLAQDKLAQESARQCELRDLLHELLAAAVQGLELNGHATERLPNTLNVRFPGVSGPDLLEAAHGVAATTGPACHDGVPVASPVLLAMGIDAQEALGAVRLSLGRGTTREQIVAAAAELGRVHRSLYARRTR